MTAIGLKEILSPNLDKAFVLAGEIVRDCIFYKTESNAGTGLLVMTALSASVRIEAADLAQVRRLAERQGWRTGLEPATTGTTTRGSTN